MPSLITKKLKTIQRTTTYLIALTFLKFCTAGLQNEDNASAKTSNTQAANSNFMLNRLR